MIFIFIYHGTSKNSRSFMVVVLQAVRRSAPQTRPPVTARVWNQRTLMKTSCRTEDLSVAELWSTQTSPRARMTPTPSNSRWAAWSLRNKLTVGFRCSASVACVCSSREEIWSTSSVSRPWARGWGSSVTKWERLSSSTWTCWTRKRRNPNAVWRRGGKVTLLNRPL